MKLPWGSWVVIIAFTLSGVLHLINPSGFYWLFPEWVPQQELLVYLSGIAELIAALGLVLKFRFAPVLTALVLLAIWPANWWFAIDSSANGETWVAILSWIRLPLQVPLIYWALKSPIRAVG